ncbi:DUF3093 domain-containing protein [Kineosporia sp. J2-2]|uniref:DUF3093 domain-containing protein n=1 Tax=Kineosporia corallincola TaxID=2835133 RepID=A0ABS5TDQ4_9ACTN|nr:DUF3093 domain-containing protein [Kineosporia corallincola]MBT0769204.1 DUF3093 domain-containing protein [Kineosporia corallincola]
MSSDQRQAADEKAAGEQAPAAAPQTKKQLSETLWPSPALWVLLVALGASFGLIPGPVNTTFAVITGVVTAVLAVALIVTLTPKVELAKGVFSAGRASVPASLIAKVEPLDAGQMRVAHGVELDARAFLCTRGWVRTGIRVTLNDPEDPTPYWLISTRKPQEWVRALGS